MECRGSSGGEPTTGLGPDVGIAPDGAEGAQYRCPQRGGALTVIVTRVPTQVAGQRPEQAANGPGQHRTIAIGNHPVEEAECTQHHRPHAGIAFGRVDEGPGQPQQVGYWPLAGEGGGPGV